MKPERIGPICVCVANLAAAVWFAVQHFQTGHLYQLCLAIFCGGGSLLLASQIIELIQIERFGAEQDRLYGDEDLPIAEEIEEPDPVLSL